MVTGDFWVLFAMLLYFIVVVIIGFIYAKKSNRSTEEYFLGGLKPRSVAYRAFRGSLRYVGLSAHGSSWSCILLWCERSGLDGDRLGIGTYLNWKFVAKRLRKYSEVAGQCHHHPRFLLESFP